MVNRWFNLLLGVALLQSVLSFGPIDETDEEWIAYRNLLRNPEYRLGDNTVPDSYEVNLTPYFNVEEDIFTFDGDVTINIQVLQQGLEEIKLHCNDLTIDSDTVFVAVNSNPTVNILTNNLVQNYTCDDRSFLTIKTPLLSVGGYIIKMSFKGNLQRTMRGFYRSWYIDENNNRRWMATTQFQPGHARQAFPCYDEPKFKAVFNISITRDIEGFSPTISNMPIREDQTLDNGKIREIFYPTPKTSTYLLAFIVSDYKKVDSNHHNLTPFHIYARGNIPTSHASYSLRVGVPLLEVMSRYTAIPYYSMAENINMKQAAIPDFSAGAMENWGLLTYREALIIYDPENSNNFYKQRIANIISHEIAHMWFGNLVTCDWWDNLWLNEGFARFYQYYLTHIVQPEQGFEKRFITEQVQVSLLSDSAPSAHPLTDSSVSSPTTVSAHFSQITYGKGAAVLRMTQHLLGNETYVNGLRRYLNLNQFSTAKPQDLFDALQFYVTPNIWPGPSGTSVSSYFSSWTNQAGHPLLTVTVVDDTGDIIITQSRFFRDANEVVPNDQIWQIPITWTRGGAPDFENLKPTAIMTSTQLVIPRTTLGREWVILNKQQSGFYRVNYDEITWALITQALRGAERETIHEYNRAQIVDDVFLLARSGYNDMSYRKAFNILSFLKFEVAYPPWLAAITGFNFVLRRLAHGSLAHTRLRAIILDWSTAVVDHLGFEEPENGNFMDDLQRMYVMTFLCNVGHQGCINAAITNFRNWRNGGRIPPNMRPWVYCNGLRYGNDEDYDFFWNKYLETDLANEQVVMITAAGCTRHQPSLNRFLNNVVGNEDTNFVVRAQDQSTGINSAITSNEVNTMAAFQWLQANINRAKAAGVLNSMLTSITSRLLFESDIVAIENWVTANADALGAPAVNAATSGFATARANIKFYDDRVKEFNEYFDAGFDDYLDPSTTPVPTVPVPVTTVQTTTTDSTTTETTTTETTTTETTTTEVTTTTEESTTVTTEPSTAPTTTPAPDSANLASLSIVTFIVTLVINMA